MTNKNKQTEEFFKELIKHGDIEKAPEGFTDRVMLALDKEESPAKSLWWQQSNILLWGSIALGILSLVVTTFMFDFSFMNSIFTGVELDGTRITQFIQYLRTGFTGIFENFSISSVTIYIVIAIGALFIVDRFLRRKPRVELNLI